ncbi:unnamed protein product [Aphis gossypii]|uniref:Uncharacterized protein n=3 Tax=Aphis gossypii TaxID=80765 RepID=A0A9P0NTD0_APHGO|nr:unnamed protein product [Aphis gossypii]
MASSPVTLPSSYVAKYNRFVDNILGRINKVLRKNYDPVNVRLQTPTQTTDHKKKGTTSQKPKTKPKVESRESVQQTEVSKNGTVTAAPVTEKSAATVSQHPTAVNGTSARSQRKHHKHHHRTSKAQNNKPKVTKNKPAAKPHSPPRARATMYGLSSLRRDGDVTVNVMNTHTTVKTKFLVGPLTLKVEKEFGRGAKKELRSATATTGELVGRLNLRVLTGGAATLHSIRVHQPKQLQIDSQDDHDKTREYVWRRSNMIAHLVSQKLTYATKSMLQPVPNKSAASKP